MRESDWPRRRRPDLAAPRRRRQDHLREEVEDAEAAVILHRPRDRPRFAAAAARLHDLVPHLVHHDGLRAQSGRHRWSPPRRGAQRGRVHDHRFAANKTGLP